MSFSPRWSRKHEAELIRRWPTDPPEEIAHDLGRSIGACHKKAIALKLPWKKWVRPWAHRSSPSKFTPTPWPNDMPDYKDNLRAAAMPFSAAAAYRAGLAGYRTMAMPTQTAMAEVVQPAGNVKKSRGAT